MHLKRWFMDWLGGRRTSGFAPVRCTIRPGEAMRIGNVQVEFVRGKILVACGRRAAFLVTPDLDEGCATVQCYSDGRALPEKVLVKKVKIPKGVPDMPKIPDPPLIRLGPGGDYTRDYPSHGPLSDAAERVRRVPEDVQPACT